MEADVGFLIGKSSSVSAGYCSNDDDLQKVALLSA